MRLKRFKIRSPYGFLALHIAQFTQPKQPLTLTKGTKWLRPVRPITNHAE
jgi:hypothetical protein